MVVSLAMGWRHLLFENWPVDPAVMAAHLPDSLTIDEFDGDAWLSVVPFTNVALRPVGLPRWMGIRLPELNVRTYVTHEGEPGVYFFSLDAEGVLSVLGARLFHSLPYFLARISLVETNGWIRFASKRYHPGARPAEYRGRYRPTGVPFAATDDPFTKFLFERYRLYTEGLDGSVRYTAVEHKPWHVTEAKAEIATTTVVTASGIEPEDSPPTYFYSPGLDIIARPSTACQSTASQS